MNINQIPAPTAAAEATVAAIDAHLRLEMLTVGLMNKGWAVQYDSPGDGVPGEFWASKNAGRVYAPFYDPAKEILICHEATDHTPEWGSSFDQQTPVSVLIGVAELVADN